MIEQGSVFVKDAVVFKEGDPPLDFGVIVNGSVELLETGSYGEVVVKRLLPGAAFGVDSFFTHQARWYTARCPEESEIILLKEGNLEGFVRDYPLLVMDILHQLSDQLEEEDNRLIDKNVGEGGVFDETKKFAIAKADDTVHINTDREYRMLLPEDHQDYLFNKEVICPVCESKFTVSQVRNSQLELKEKREDFRRVMKQMDPLWYDIWRCPSCGYANFKNDYFKINNLVRAELKETLPRNGHHKEQRLVKHNISEVFNDYFALEQMLDKVAYSPFSKARWWQCIAWLLEDVGDDEAAYEARRVLRVALQEAWYSSTEALTPDDDLKLSIKIAALLEEEKSINEARNYLLKGTQLKGTSTVLKKQAQNKLLDLKELYLQMKKNGELG